jgi:hypothetical protein
MDTTFGVLEKSGLPEISEPIKRTSYEDGEICKIPGFINLLFAKYYYTDQMTEDVTGEA